MMGAPDRTLLAVDGLVKDFGSNRVLDGIDFAVQPGEVHALLGENGAGKSTLIKVVAGIEPATAGRVRVCGRALSHRPDAAELAAAGIAFVHQDLSLAESLSVAENIAMPDDFVRVAGLISFRRTRSRARDLLQRLEIDLDPDALVGDLNQDQKVLVAVTRAFAREARIIVLDEVSASLPTPEFERFAAAIRRSTSAGVGYVYVTHRIEEVFELATRVTVLRDGKVAGSGSVGDFDHDDIVDLILGGAIEDPGAAQVPVGGATSEVALRVGGLRGGGLVEPIDFEVRAGEIIGFCGLVGSGARAVAQILGGASTVAAGGAELAGRPLPLHSPRLLSRAGVSYVPGDRDREGALSQMSVRENLFLVAGSGGLGGLRSGRTERPVALRTADRFGVRPSGDVERLVGTLSGGNRQKVVFARAMSRNPRLLVLDDPTQGVDIGSRLELHELVRQTAAEGTPVVFASSDFEEVANLAHRALVMNRGCLVGELSAQGLTSDNLAKSSYRELDRNGDQA